MGGKQSSSRAVNVSNPCNDISANTAVIPPEPPLVPCSELCNQKWESYVDKDYKLQDGWEINLDDTREFESSYTMTQFLANCTNIFENLLYGSQDFMSGNVHSVFVDVIVKRLESVIHIDYLHNRRKVFNSSIRFTRMNDDHDKSRKQQIIFVMSLRITGTGNRHGDQNELDTVETNVEMFVRIQLRSIRQRYKRTRNDGDDDDDVDDIDDDDAGLRETQIPLWE